MVLDGFEMSRSPSTMHTSQSSPNCLFDDVHNSVHNGVRDDDVNPFGNQFVFPTIDMDSRTTSKSSVSQSRPSTGTRDPLPPRVPGELVAKKISGILKSNNLSRVEMTSGGRNSCGKIYVDTRRVHGVPMVPRIRTLDDSNPYLSASVCGLSTVEQRKNQERKMVAQGPDGRTLGKAATVSSGSPRHSCSGSTVPLERRFNKSCDWSPLTVNGLYSQSQNDALSLKSFNNPIAQVS
ncbi:hypothetical protein FO519_005770 [Halicephalobus sp. NKZ332]|nr:hypothetical protein FO519_005770 [Halicephalobus sp. NKZ332]